VRWGGTALVVATAVACSGGTMASDELRTRLPAESIEIADYSFEVVHDDTSEAKYFFLTSDCSIERTVMRHAPVGDVWGAFDPVVNGAGFVDDRTLEPGGYPQTAIVRLVSVPDPEALRDDIVAELTDCGNRLLGNGTTSASAEALSPPLDRELPVEFAVDTSPWMWGNTSTVLGSTLMAAGDLRIAGNTLIMVSAHGASLDPSLDVAEAAKALFLWVERFSAETTAAL